MRYNNILIALSAILIFNCKQPKFYVSKVEGKQIQITDSLANDHEIESFIEPYRKHIKKELDSILAYSPKTYSNSDGFLNSSLGNYLADIVFDECNPVFNVRTGKNIDMVILNQGGIRSIISKGNVSAKTAYEIMPFENKIVVVALKGSQIEQLSKYLIQEKKAHPLSKIKLVVNSNFEVIETSINEKPVEMDKIYYIATNDYLYNGGDDMTFFKPNEGLFRLDYKIRDIIIDNFKKIDTIIPKTDQRFYQKK